jgi:hypothetical protein
MQNHAMVKLATAIMLVLLMVNGKKTGSVLANFKFLSTKYHQLNLNWIQLKVEYVITR